MPEKSLITSWQQCLEMLVEEGITSHQVSLYKRSYYMGAMHVCNVISRLCDPVAAPSPEDIQQLLAITGEIETYLQDQIAEELMLDSLSEDKPS
jgi:hypothetical protein